MKRTIPLTILLIPFCLITITATAQPDPDFEQWKKQQQQAFQTFKDERDRAFAEFLKREWREMQLMRGIVPDETPKPIDIPVYIPPVEPPSEVIPAETPIVEPIPIPEQQSVITPLPIPDIQPERSALLMNFFDTPLTIAYDDGLKVPFGDTIDKENISAFWEAMSQADYDEFLAQVQDYKQQMVLNDWGYCLLLYQLGDKLYAGDRNPAVLFVWFMLSKSGYAAKVGYDENQIYLMLPSVNTVYDVPYTTLEAVGQRFYVLPFDSESKPNVEKLYTHDGTYPGAERQIDFQIEQPPKFGSREGSRTFEFTYKGKKYTFGVKFNQSLVDFLKNFPATDLSVRFNASLSFEARLSLFSALKPLLEGKSKIEALNLLLRFVQTAFAYKTDQEQFGAEKALFPEETLCYDASDCEDRSVLFAFLARKLLGLKVIGLDFPGHIATAVKLEVDVPGDAVEYQNERYMICDPTYINAELGICMPRFKTVNPRVIIPGEQ